MTTLTSGNSQNMYQSTPSTMPMSNNSNTATMRRQNPPSNAAQHQKHHDSIEAIPSSNSIDSAMYERDKQIYKCSTMRQGGKFDPKYKPSILNCPLPEIPKDAESPKKESVKEHSSSYSKTLQRPPMKLPPPGKAIPPPKIDTPTSPPLPPPPLQSVEKNSTLNQGGTNIQHVKSPSTPVQSPKLSERNKSVDQHHQEQSTINPNDESNYAVTEL